MSEDENCLQEVGQDYHCQHTSHNNDNELLLLLLLSSSLLLLCEVLQP